MERIKQALEKARHQQPTQSPSTAQSHKAAVKAEINAEAGLVELNYTQTKLLRLKPGVLEQNRIVALNKADPVTGVFDVLRTKILQKMEENGWRTIAITSPVPACGKTMVSVNLAMSIAQQTNKTVMLVDFDLRRPTVAKYLGLDMDKSLNDLLDGNDVELSEVLVNPEIPRFVVLPTAKPFKKPAETITSKKAVNLIKELRDRYEERIVIFDLPPILAGDDVISVLPNIDCVLMVIGNGMVSTSELEDSIRHLHGAQLIGTVLNKAEIKAPQYYY
jgi:hypothetical protein